jgi:hypothetical protein
VAITGSQTDSEKHRDTIVTTKIGVEQLEAYLLSNVGVPGGIRTRVTAVKVPKRDDDSNSLQMTPISN